LPEGVLKHRGENVISLAVISGRENMNSLPPIRLEVLRNVRGGVTMVTQYDKK
jgi:hypothetical protein